MSQQPSIFFPERMDQIEMICPLESAYYALKGIAGFGSIELIDNNSDAHVQKRHADSYIQCEEADRSLRFIGQYLKQIPAKDGKSLLPPKIPIEDYKVKRADMNVNDVIQRIRRADSDLHEKITIYENMKTQQKKKVTELKALRFYRTVADSNQNQNTIDATGSHNESMSSVEMTILDDVDDVISSSTGFVQTSVVQKMMTMIFRASRKNVIYHLGEADGDMTPFSVFTSSHAILNKINKICESFTQDVFDFSDSTVSLSERETRLLQEIEQMKAVESSALEANQEFLLEISGSFWEWKYFITQEKQILLYLDYGDYNRVESSVIYTGWIPHISLPQIYPILEEATRESGSALPIQIHVIPAEQILEANQRLPIEEQKEIIIPTYIERNEFSYPFQLLNDAYGIPNYDELNGGAFYGMYPMLFAIMFGDIGHAIFYLIASIAIIVMSKKTKAEGMLETVLRLKWLILFASICALYCGFIYNECFGLPLSLFSTSYEKVENPSGTSVWNKTSNSVYPFGIDPSWLFKDNELIFLNSYKMKLSIVMGMLQMIFGMFLQLINHIHRKDVKTILIKWVPQMLYLVPFFGYLVVLIIKKWLTHFQNNNEFVPDVQENGVNLIQIMINMILSFGNKDVNFQLYKSQWDVHTVIVILFFISIPYLLFAKPICDCIKLRGTKQFNVLEIFVMNLIGVIEFCLGALSHTASYLRLWALSLAHSQLSHVIYEELFIIEVNSGNPVLIFVGFAGFAALSAAILLGMEAFSALLHAIRLMWVEFSSKFYEGMGVSFKPISFAKEIKHITV